MNINTYKVYVEVKDDYGSILKRKFEMVEADNYAAAKKKMHKILSENEIKSKVKIRIYPKKCTTCKSGMNEGYHIKSLNKNFCSDSCLHTIFADEKSLSLNGKDVGIAYWTRWV